MNATPDETLARLWNNAAPRTDDADAIPVSLREAIARAVNSKFKLFRYILPSQLLAKFVDESRNTLALQDQSKLPGSFDARSFCKDHITKFDEANHGVLGGSEDPGVGNIWRYPQIDEHWLGIGRRRQSGGTDLYDVLSYAQQQPETVEALLRFTLKVIAERLARTKIVYPRPNRISLSSFEKLITSYLATRSGGRRLQAVAAALFDIIGVRFSLFHAVEVGHINKSDAARRDVADLDCRNIDGKTVMSVEIKDRDLSVREVNDTLKIARDRGVAEIVYVIRGGVASGEGNTYAELVNRQFIAGHNVYDIQFEVLLHTCLILFGESGRLELLEAIGRRIDGMGELIDRQDWQAELSAI